jgi:hypothetical protein
MGWCTRFSRSEHLIYVMQINLSLRQMHGVRLISLLCGSCYCFESGIAVHNTADVRSRSVPSTNACQFTLQSPIYTVPAESRHQINTGFTRKLWNKKCIISYYTGTLQGSKYTLWTINKLFLTEWIYLYFIWYKIITLVFHHLICHSLFYRMALTQNQDSTPMFTNYLCICHSNPLFNFGAF